MPANPLPIHLTLIGQCRQGLPQVSILDRFTGGSLPAPPPPVGKPFGDAFLNILRIGENTQRLRGRHCLKRPDYREQFHTVIRRIGLAAEQLPFDTVGDDQGSPAARSGVSFAGSVSEDLGNVGHGEAIPL